jgi:hypothetical protein
LFLAIQACHGVMFGTDINDAFYLLKGGGGWGGGWGGWGGGWGGWG